MNNDLNELEGRVATALRSVASTVPDEPPIFFSGERGVRRRGRHQTPQKAQRQKAIYRAALVGAGAIAVSAAILGGLAVRAPSNTPHTSSFPAGHGAAPMQPSPPPVTIHYQVAGYTTEQATAAAAQCLSAAGTAGEQGAVLRATFSDAGGSTLVVTTPSGWNTCDASADGTVLVADPFKSYADAQGWGQSASPATDPSADWLIAPVELDSDGGGYLSKSTMSDGWLDVAVGRVAPNITKVTIQMPGGSTVTASVENGFFVARQLLPSAPSFSQAGTVPILGYDSSSNLVYDSLTAPSALPAHFTPTWQPPCFVTSNGQPVSSNAVSGQKCLKATAWPE
jgi:hypothetical protein